MRRIGLFVLAVLLGGCVQPDAAPEPEQASPSPTAAPEQPASIEQAPPPPARVADAGFSWNDCVYFTSALAFKHEWANVPEGYRMANTLAGNVGQASLQIFDCSGISIGNQTLLANASFGYLAILVEPPAGMGHAESDFFVVAPFSDAALLVEQLNEVGLGAFEAATDAAAARVDSVPLTATATTRPTAANANATASLRLHWVDGQTACWADMHHIATDLTRGEVVATFEGARAGLAGPLGRLAGLGSHGTEDGFASPPACVPLA